ncbi:hypothetical protein [Phaeobacter sp. 11ANDIMAR09]|uniref:hypothetical protein n=1 Tax=Phaeobacter sp. 11ANDIMAR09 TaxID=1225647 RepID=UPI0006C8E570|nr:hypothetical protein [Phaeobacter sp. 11ANDIMAR09]KPD13138.1 hypothetical protein AN476_07550 [Phaeobacter sp. 11ANDIMAR09]
MIRASNESICFSASVICRLTDAFDFFICSDLPFHAAWNMVFAIANIVGLGSKVLMTSPNAPSTLSRGMDLP